MPTKATRLPLAAGAEGSPGAPGANPELRAVLDKHGLKYAAFEQLQPSSYEHCLARHNVTQLDRFYSVLFSPGMTLAEIREECPPWPRGTPRAGQQPSDSMLSGIAKRWRAELALDSFEEAERFVTRLQGKLAALPAARTEPVTDSLFNLLGQELLESRFTGRPVSEQLAALDRLIAKGKLDNAREETELAKARWMREAAQIVLDALADGRAAEIEASRSSNTEKLQALGRLMFGEDFDRLTSGKPGNAPNAPGRAATPQGSVDTPAPKKPLAEAA